MRSLGNRPIRGAVFWTGAYVVFVVRPQVLAAMETEPPVGVMRALAFGLVLAPFGGWALYLLLFRFLFGLVRLVPVAGGGLYRAVDVLLHGSDVASANAADDGAREEEANANSIACMNLSHESTRGDFVVSDAGARELLDTSVAEHWAGVTRTREGLRVGTRLVSGLHLDRRDLQRNGNDLHVQLDGVTIKVGEIVAWGDSGVVRRMDGKDVGTLDSAGRLRVRGSDTVEGGFTGERTHDDRAATEGLARRLEEIRRAEQRARVARDVGSAGFDPGAHSAGEVVAGQVEARVQEEIDRRVREETPS